MKRGCVLDFWHTLFLLVTSYKLFDRRWLSEAFALRGKTVEKIGMNFMIDEDKTIVLDWWKFEE